MLSKIKDFVTGSELREEVKALSDSIKQATAAVMRKIDSLELLVAKMRRRQ